MGELWADVSEGTARAIWGSGVAPPSTDQPGWLVEEHWPFRVELACDGRDESDVVAVHEARAQEHSADVHVVGDVAAGQLFKFDPEVADQQFDCHGGLLGADLMALSEAGVDLRGCRSGCPQSAGVTRVDGADAICCHHHCTVLGLASGWWAANQRSTS